MGNRKLIKRLEKIIQPRPSLEPKLLEIHEESNNIIVTVYRTEIHYESYLIDWATDADDAQMYFDAMTDAEKRDCLCDDGMFIHDESTEIEVLGSGLSCEPDTPTDLLVSCNEVVRNAADCEPAFIGLERGGSYAAS